MPEVVWARARAAFEQLWRAPPGGTRAGGRATHGGCEDPLSASHEHVVLGVWLFEFEINQFSETQLGLECAEAVNAGIRRWRADVGAVLQGLERVPDPPLAHELVAQARRICQEAGVSLRARAGRDHPDPSGQPHPDVLHFLFSSALAHAARGGAPRRAAGAGRAGGPLSV